MKRKELLNALTAVKPGIASREIVESMTYFYFSGTHVTTYNDVISVQYPLKIDFTAFVKADDFYKALSKIITENVNLELIDDKLHMKSNKVKTSFATIEDPEIVSMINSVDESISGIEKYRKLPSNFCEAVKMCSFVASRNESDQTLTCIYINGTNVAASDNTRIAFSTVKSKMPKMLVKASEIDNLININPTAYALTKSWIHFKGESGCIFSVRRVIGEYPDFSGFMNFEGQQIELPKEVLDGLDLASIFTDEENPSISVSVKKGVCRIFKESAAGSIDYREKIKWDGEPFTFNVSPVFLAEMLHYNTEITVASDKAKLNSGDFTMITALYGDQ